MYKIKLFINIDINGTTAINGFVDYDSTKLTMKADNDNGRKMISLTGNIEIAGPDYRTFFELINSGTYFNGFYAKFELYKTGTKIMSGYLNLTENNKDESRAAFRIKRSTGNVYDTIKVYGDQKENIYDVPTVSKLKYLSHKTIGSRNQYYTHAFDCKKNEDGIRDVDLNDVEEYFDVLRGFNPLETIEFASFSYIDGNCLNDTIDLGFWITYNQLLATGFYKGIERVPPAGVGWHYKDDIVVGSETYPRFAKGLDVLNRDVGALIEGKVCIGKNLYYYDFIQYDLSYNYVHDYINVARKLEDVIPFLMNKASSSVQFDMISWQSLTNYQGLNDFGTGQKSSFTDLMLIGLSDFIPSKSDEQKTNRQEVLNISLNDVLLWLEKWGFFWYIEYLGGVPYFRLKLLEDKTLGNGNPKLNNFHGQNWLYLSKNIEWKEASWLQVSNNTTSSGFEFDLPYRADAGFPQTPELSIDDGIFYTDIDYVTDAKGAVFNDSGIDKFVLIAARWHPVTSYYSVRQTEGKYTELPNVNNNELSFGYLAENTLAGLFGYLSPGMNPKRFEKRRKITLEIPNENDYDSFNFFDYIEFFGEEAEIESWECKLSDNFATLKIKY